MFTKIFAKKDKNESKNLNSELKEKIAKMNLAQMRLYIKNNLDDFSVSVEGINEIVKKLISFDEKKQIFYIKNDDMDVKKKKAFDLIIAILTSKHISIQTIELAQKFLENYKEMINDFDKRNKQIYASRLKDSIKNAISTINQYADLQEKMNLLGE